jgi:hypothetical protein
MSNYNYIKWRHNWYMRFVDIWHNLMKQLLYFLATRTYAVTNFFLRFEWRIINQKNPIISIISMFPFVVLPSYIYLFTVGVEVVYLHLITLRHTPQSVGLLWTRDRPPQRPLPDNTNTQKETNIHAPGRIRTHDPSKRSAADLHPRPRGHWDRHK